MKTHPLSVTHLVVGLVFLGVAGSWALRQADVIGTDDFGWLLPAALVVAGAVGLLAALAKGLTGRDERAPSVESEYDDGYRSTYDPPLHQDYTSDLDARLAAADQHNEPDAPEVTDTTTVIATDTDPHDNDPHDKGENR